MPGVLRTPAVKGIPRSRGFKAVGFDGRLVLWYQPKTRPTWLARETLAALPGALVAREVRYRIGRPGFRTREITLVTTLLDAAVYRVADLAELYRWRWRVEVCQTQPVNMTWCPLRHASRTINDLRGPLKREYVGDIHVLPGDDDFPDQELRDGLAFFKGEPVQVVIQQAPKGFGMLDDLLPMPRLLLGAGSWLAFLLDLLELGSEFQPPTLSCTQANNLSLIRIQSALALPL